jgi:hypothetical protein
MQTGQFAENGVAASLDGAVAGESGENQCLRHELFGCNFTCREFWPAIARKSPLSGRVMAVFANVVMMQKCH